MSDVCFFCRNPLGGSYTYHWSRACHHECVPMDEKDRRLAAALTRIAALEAQLADRVKPLKWLNVRVNYGPETYEAKTPVGFYQVFTDEDSAAGSVFAEWAWNQNQFGMTGATSIGRYPDFLTAKAAAQADFDRRILSALEATPPAPKVTEALTIAHEALEAASDQILESYRTWVADDKDAKPRYGQYPRYDQVNAAIRVVSEALTAAQEAGKP